MSNSTAAPEALPRGDARALLLRTLLVAGYLVLAHGAGIGHDARLAALALADIVVLVLIGPLLRLRPWAWITLALAGMALAALSRTPHALTPLLLVPPAFVALVAFGFARTLVPGRVPLITAMASALEGGAPGGLAPDLYAYTRRLTACWAALLGGLALFNLLLAALAVPQGLLAAAGWPSPWPIDEATWAIAAHAGNYGVVGGFMLLEFQVRKRRFPHRYHSFFAFLRQLASLGPAFLAGTR